MLWTATSLAGSGVSAFAEGIGAAASFLSPLGACAAPSGSSIYVSDSATNPRLRSVSASLGSTATFVGSGSAGTANGVGTSASLTVPRSCAVSPSGGTLYLATAPAVRVVDVSTKATTTLVGGIAVGFANGVGTNAAFNSTGGVALDVLGITLFVADTENHRIRAVDIATATASTFAGSGVASCLEGRGTSATFNSPSSVAVTPDGTVFVADRQNHRIRRISAVGLVTTLAGSALWGGVDAATGDSATFSYPSGIAISPSGMLVVTEFLGHRVRLVNAVSGATFTVAGDGVAGYIDSFGATSRLANPTGVAVVASTGTIYFADSGNYRVRALSCAVCPIGFFCNDGAPTVCPAGTFGNRTGLAACFPCNALPGRACAPGSTSASGTLCPAGSFCVGGAAPAFPCTCASACPPGVTGIAEDPMNLVWTVRNLAGSGVAGCAQGTGTSAVFTNMNGGHGDAAGNLIVSDQTIGNVWRVTPSGVASIIAGTPGPAANLAFADGTGTNALFNKPCSTEVDMTTGVIYVADNVNNRVRAISTGRVVTTFAFSGVAGSADGPAATATTTAPTGLALTPDGSTLYVWGTHAIRSISIVNGVAISADTLAGTGVAGFSDGVGPLATLNAAWDGDVDPVTGNIVFGDWNNRRLRVATPAGVVTTISGNGVNTWLDGAKGQYVGIVSNVVLSSGAHFLSDFTGFRIRLYVPSTGITYTLAGAGATGTVNGNGTLAKFLNPLAVVPNMQTGSFIIADRLTVRTMTCSVCPLGFYCVRGTPYQCPAGTFGNSSRLSSSSCAGPCRAAVGSYCPAGSTSAAGVPCPPNFVCAGSTSQPVCAAAAGSYCVTATTALPCPAGYSCAGLSAAPVPCSCSGLCGAGLAADPYPNPSWTLNSPVAGSGTCGFADGAGASGLFRGNRNLDVTSTGTFVIADDGNHAIRLVSPSGSVTTLAGLGFAAGFVDGVGTNARFNRPLGVSVSSSGTIFVADYANNAIRAVSPVGAVSTLAGNGTVGKTDGLVSPTLNGPHGVCVNNAGTTVYVTEASSHVIRSVVVATGLTARYAGIFGTATYVNGLRLVSTFYSPKMVVADLSNNLYVAGAPDHFGWVSAEVSS